MRSITNWRGQPLDVYFFGLVFLVFPLLTDLEYHVYERVRPWPAWTQWGQRLLYGVFDILAYGLYYRLVLPVLLAKRYVVFTGLLLVFFWLLNLYQQYIVYGLVMHLSFLPESMTNAARRWFTAPTPVHFSVINVLRQLGLVTMLGYFRQNSRQQQQLHQLSHQRLQTELDSLKAQLQPHFFFNTLNNIYALAQQSSPKTAPLIARHADIMRYVLHRAQRAVVPLTEELAFLASYLAVEAVRFPESTPIQLETQNIGGQWLIEPLLLLPFVENTIKHGLAGETETGFVHIAAVVIDDELLLQTRNSKPQSTRSIPLSGLGLTMARRRLAGLYPGQRILLDT